MIDVRLLGFGSGASDRLEETSERKLVETTGGGNCGFAASDPGARAIAKHVATGDTWLDGVQPPFSKDVT